MEILLALLIGLATAAGAVLFPGMLNMTAVSTSLRAGRRAGYRFASGLSSMLTLQAGVAIIFADFLVAHPGIIEGMKRWAIVIFGTLAVFFLIKGWRVQHADIAAEDRPYHGSPFWRGVAMAVMNFLTLPYFFAVGGWLIADGYLASALAPKVFFTVGAGLGSLTIFGAYARLADWIKRNALFLTRNINYILGGLFVVLAVAQGIRIYG